MTSLRVWVANLGSGLTFANSVYDPLDGVAAIVLSLYLPELGDMFRRDIPRALVVFVVFLEKSFRLAYLLHLDCLSIDALFSILW